MNYCESNEFLSLTCGVECFPYRYIVPFLLLISFFPTHLNLFLYRFKKRNHFNSVRALLSLVVWWLFFFDKSMQALIIQQYLFTHTYLQFRVYEIFNTAYSQLLYLSGCP